MKNNQVNGRRSNGVTALKSIVMSHAPNPSVARKLALSLRDLIEKHSYLLKIDSSERSISHQLALHITSHFKGFDVDCEYNRNLHEIKKLHLSSSCARHSDTDGSSVYPDIVVHHRNTSNNYLVIEVKKSTSDISEDCDLEKLTAFKQELRYKYAVFLRLLCKNDNPGLEKILWR